MVWHPIRPYSRPFNILVGASFELASAQRWDLIIRPNEAVSFPAKAEFRQWVTGEVLGSAETVINVT
ncbi:MAG TPA: hypothetical protein VJO15_03290 [Dehalococcoidia bacterium]|nr:hypothetical protein [Dehalococcoidia bacterium]